MLAGTALLLVSKEEAFIAYRLGGQLAYLAIQSHGWSG